MVIFNSQNCFLFKEIFVKAGLFCLAVYLSLSCPIVAMEDAKIRQEEEAQNLSIHPTDRIEFAFVLLPDESILEDIRKVAAEVSRKVTALEKSRSNPEWGDYYDKIVNIPHVSIGQYGFLGIEYSLLTNIVFRTAQKFKPLTEPISRNLSVTNENIFLDCQSIKENTNPTINDMYVDLRTQFMNKMTTRFPITQALLGRFRNKDNLEELSLIDKCYQNWGTPEGNRIRPHFTLLYNYGRSEEAVKDVVANIILPSSLEIVTFNKLGIVQIDLWGNPTKLLYVTSLSG